MNEHDQDWTEAVGWFGGHELTPELIERFEFLLCCETEAMRAQSTPDELEIIQRISRIAFYDSLSRHNDQLR